MIEQHSIYLHLIDTILHQLPLCSDLHDTILSYISSSRPKLCKLLSYKLIRMNNVKNPTMLLNKATQLDKCPALLKSFDTIWDLFSTFLVKDEDKEIIEHWYLNIHSTKSSTLRINDA
jgi:hypothetical protein